MLIMIIIAIINLIFIFLTDNIYIVCLSVICTLGALGIISRIIKNKQINKLYLQELNIDEFIKIMDLYIKKTRLTELKIDYSINKADALIAKGNYLEAIEFCKNLSLSKMNDNAKISYFISFFNALIYSEQIEEAKQLYLQNEAYFIKGLSIKSIYFEAQSASVIYYMYDGQLQKSKELLNQLKAHKYYKNYKLYRLKVEFLLAREEIAEGNKEGKAHLNTILPQAKNTYIAKEIAKELNLKHDAENYKENTFIKSADQKRGKLKKYVIFTRIIGIAFILSAIFIVKQSDKDYFKVVFNHYTVSANAEKFQQNKKQYTSNYFDLYADGITYSEDKMQHINDFIEMIIKYFSLDKADLNSEHKLKIFALHKDEYENAFGNKTSGKFYSNSKEVYVNIDDGMCTVNHELTHYIIDLAGIDLKTFDSEGLARFFEATISYYPEKQEKVPAVTFGYLNPAQIQSANMFINSNKNNFSLEQLISANKLNQDNQDVASTFFCYMYQKGYLKNYFNLLKKEQDPTKRIEKVTGKSISEIQEEYIEWLYAAQENTDLNVAPQTVIYISTPYRGSSKLHYNKKLRRWSFIN